MGGSLRALFITDDPAPWGLAACYQRTFRKAGHVAEVFFLSGFDTQSLAAKALNRFPLAAAARVRKRLPQLFKETRAFRPDLIFICKGNNLDAGVLDELKSLSGSALLNLYTDNPLVDPGHAAFTQFSTRLSRYDCVFSFSRALVSVFEMCGAPKVVHLPFAHDPEVHQPAVLSPEERIFYGSPVACLSTWGAIHERWLERLAPFGLKIWGRHWHHLRPSSPLAQCWQKPGAIGVGLGSEMAKVCGSSSIIFNLMRPEQGAQVSMKTFELPACGAFVISNRTSEQLECLEEDRCMVYFSTARELDEKVRFYLQREDLRRKIAASAYEEVRSRHSYAHRLEIILRVYGELR